MTFASCTSCIRSNNPQGEELLNDPSFNKGSAFNEQERKEFALNGLLPSRVHSLDEQVERAYDQFQDRSTAIGKNTFMTSMKEQNEVLYFKLIQMHLKEMFPIIYTPTEGDAIANYSRLFRKPEGCFLTIDKPDDIESILDRRASPDDIDIIAVSDGEQILGIGDQGVGGILISIAKLVIYTLCAGIHPSRTLPVILDTGTDNHSLLNDELYLGLQRPRIRGEEYDAFVDRFISAARKRYPKALIHFEDFGLPNARRILDQHSDKIPCFNDDVQGTGCVTLAALYAACKVANLSLADLRVVMYGSGTAGTGIADQITDAMALESGKSKDQARKQIYCFDKPGILLASMKDDLTPAQHPYARVDSEWPSKEDNKSLLSIVKQVKPHVLIGTSTKPKSFTKDIVQEMASHVDRPIIFPLSNPTRLHEGEPNPSPSTPTPTPQTPKLTHPPLSRPQRPLPVDQPHRTNRDRLALPTPTTPQQPHAPNRRMQQQHLLPRHRARRRALWREANNALDARGSDQSARGAGAGAAGPGRGTFAECGGGEGGEC